MRHARSKVLSIKTLGMSGSWECTRNLPIIRIIYCTFQYKKVHGKWVIYKKLKLIYDFGLIKMLKIEQRGHVLTCLCQGFPINTGSILGRDQTTLGLLLVIFDAFEIDLVSQTLDTLTLVSGFVITSLGIYLEFV